MSCDPPLFDGYLIFCRPKGVIERNLTYFHRLFVIKLVTVNLEGHSSQVFALLIKMLGNAQSAFSPNIKFLRLPVFKILQFKISRFPLTVRVAILSVL